MRRPSTFSTSDNTASSYHALFALLGDDEEQAARRYILVREKLIMYFEGRKISPSEDYADEVLHRTASKIAAGESIEDIDRYIFGIARFVRLESYRKPETEIIEEEHASDGEGRSRTPNALTVAPSSYTGNEDGSESVMHGCLRECLGKLESDKRQLILDYYEPDEKSGTHIEHRRRLAEQQRKTPGALQKQICLLRQKVSSCTKDCVRKGLG